MDPNIPSTSEQQLECTDEVQLRHQTQEVKFYLRDSICSDEESSDSDTNEISDSIAQLPSNDVDDDLRKHLMKASLKRKEWSLSVEKSFDIPNPPSDDTLTSFSSSSASTLDRPSSDEMHRISYLSSSSANNSSCTMMNLQRGNSDDDAVIDECADSVPDMTYAYRRMSSIDKRDVYKNSSTDSDDKSSGVFSGSTSSSQLNQNSATSLSGVEIDGMESEAKTIRRNFEKIVEEIDSALVLSQMHKEGNIDSDSMIAIQELPTRRDRAIETLLLVLMSDRSCSAFYRICINTYEHVFKNLSQDKPSSKMPTYFCKRCLEMVKTCILELIHEIESTFNTSVCINALLYRLIEVDLVTPTNVLSVHRKTKEDKTKLLMTVASNLSQETGHYPGNFLWALLSSDTITSKDDLTKLVNKLENDACQICREVLHKLVSENCNEQLMMTSINHDVEEKRQITILFHDLSSCKGKDERVVLIKLKTKDDKKVQEIFLKKKDKLNEAIADIARIDDVLVGSVILKLIFKDTEVSTKDAFVKIEKVLQTVLSEQEIKDYLESGDMEISLSVCDRNAEIGDDPLLNQKLTIILNMTVLLEELDAISFKQNFIDKGILSDKEFDVQFKVNELCRRARTSLLLKYVLRNNADVMNAFLEVIGRSYNSLKETLKRRQFIGCDETETKQHASTPKIAMEHNELGDRITESSSLDINFIGLTASSHSVDESHIGNGNVPNNCLNNNSEMQSYDSSSGPKELLFKQQTASTCNSELLQFPSSGSRKMESFSLLSDLNQEPDSNQSLKCVRPHTSLNPNSQMQSCDSSSGPKGLLLDQQTTDQSSLLECPPSRPSGIELANNNEICQNSQLSNLNLDGIKGNDVEGQSSELTSSGPMGIPLCNDAAGQVLHLNISSRSKVHHVPLQSVKSESSAQKARSCQTSQSSSSHLSSDSVVSGSMGSSLSNKTTGQGSSSELTDQSKCFPTKTLENQWDINPLQGASATGDRNETMHLVNFKYINVLNGIKLQIIPQLSCSDPDDSSEIHA